MSRRGQRLMGWRDWLPGRTEFGGLARLVTISIGISLVSVVVDIAMEWQPSEIGSWMIVAMAITAHFVNERRLRKGPRVS